MYTFKCQACGMPQYSSNPSETGKCIFCGREAVRRERPAEDQLQKDLQELAMLTAQISARHGGIYVTAVILADGDMSIAMANPQPDTSMQVRYDLTRDISFRR